MSNTIYSAGYQRLDIALFCAFVERENLTVVDVRLKPFSRQFQWNQKAMVARLGDRYVHLPELGNLNYKGGPITLQDPVVGLTKLRGLIEAGSVVVLCVCADPSICHRTVAIKELGGDYQAVPLFPERLRAMADAATAPALPL